jgi:serine protease
MKLHAPTLGLGLAAVLAAGACGPDFYDTDPSETGGNLGSADSPHGEISEHDRYIVQFSDEPALMDRALSEVRLHGEILVELGPQNAVAARIPASALAAVRSSPGVAYVEVDQPRYPLAAQEVPFGIEMVQAHLVSDAPAGNMTVCVIDSGYDLGHEDLPAGAHVTRSNILDTGDAFVDGCGHGTHVAGTIAALNNDAGVVGVLPSGTINLHIVKYFSNSCRASFVSSLVRAANRCVDAGANVINMSLGGPYSRTGERYFNELFESGAVLPVAAAGNSGNGQRSYPASYAGVISVAAIDENKERAEFSQFNDDVELAAPGVGVLSTVPRGTAEVASFTVGDDSIAATGMDGSPLLSAAGALVDCGLGTSACVGAEGAVCLIERGEVSFSDKVENCERGGGVAAVIYNNEPGALVGTLGNARTSIPSAGIAQDAGHELLARVSDPATLAVEPGDYARNNGTSMASPHVAGVAALVWSHFPELSAAEIREVLQETAEDLGAPGRDPEFGFGLVQAKAALDALAARHR